LDKLPTKNRIHTYLGKWVLHMLDFKLL
jgi:hypothetical protein